MIGWLWDYGFEDNEDKDPMEAKCCFLNQQCFYFLNTILTEQFNACILERGLNDQNTCPQTPKLLISIQQKHDFNLIYIMANELISFFVLSIIIK